MGQIEVEKNAAKFEISYIGFIPETFVLKKDAQRLPRLSLTPDINALEEVVVTATRTPKALKDVPVVTRLISSDDIKKADATNIHDLLTEELPGLEFSYAMSQETSLNMNGFGGKAILFLVDGERLAGETMDKVDFNRLFERLHEIGYDSYVTIEREIEGEEQNKDILHAKKYLGNIIERVYGELK